MRKRPLKDPGRLPANRNEGVIRVSALFATAG
jgi:hypothetical protein